MAKKQHVCTICGTEFLAYETNRMCCSIQCSATYKSIKSRLRIEEEYGKPISDVIRTLYTEQRMSVREIEPVLGVGNHTILDWLNEFNIEIRRGGDAIKTQWEGNDERRIATSQNMKRMRHDGTIDLSGDKSFMRTPEMRKHFSDMRKGSGNPMWNKLGPESVHWKGGKITYRGAGWLSVRTRIVRRDGYECRRCGETKKQLQVHHIIPYRETQNNSPDNLITLCVRCHALAERGSIDLFAENVIDSELAKRLFKERESQLLLPFE